MFSKLKSIKSSLHLKHSKRSSKDMKDGMPMAKKEGMMGDDMSMSTAQKSDSMMSSDMSSDMSSKDMPMDMSSKDGMMGNNKDAMMMEDKGAMSNDMGSMMPMEGTMSHGMMKTEMNGDSGMKDGMMKKDDMGMDAMMKKDDMGMDAMMKKDDMGMEGGMMKKDDMGGMMEKDDMTMDKSMKVMASDKAMMKKSEPQIAIFGAGCFWGTENMFLKHYPPKENKGIISTSVGFIDGVKDVTDPSGKTTKGRGSAEACRVVFDPSIVSYAELVEFFYRFHDPTMLDYQGNDQGKEYRSAIFTSSDEQGQIARRVTAEVQAKHFDLKKQKVVTRIELGGSWHESPAAHQQYLLRNPNGYHCYTHKLHW